MVNISWTMLMGVGTQGAPRELVQMMDITNTIKIMSSPIKRHILISDFASMIYRLPHF